MNAEMIRGWLGDAIFVDWQPTLLGEVGRAEYVWWLTTDLAVFATSLTLAARPKSWTP